MTGKIVQRGKQVTVPCWVVIVGLSADVSLAGFVRKIVHSRA
ncbi:MAG TPA: hypothetical protein VIS96_12550 [Terrimicrobiaceae bacterium]